MGDLVRIGEVARMLRLSTSRVRQLADDGTIPSQRTSGGHRMFDPDQVRSMLVRLPTGRSLSVVDDLGVPVWTRDYPLPGLKEHEVWRSAARDLGLEAGSDATHIMEYAFEEMVNNAIEHSGGTEVRTAWWLTPAVLAFRVADDGVGAFARLREGHDLPDDLSAIQELSKGKRTTDPQAHSGQGIFFTSKAVDRFSLEANRWRWTVDNEIGDQTVDAWSSAVGTTVVCRIQTDTTRSMTQVMTAYQHDLAFDRTRPAVKLAAYGTRLVSRSEARLLMEGLDRFSDVDMDFAGVDAVGQGFVDEVFRVWAAAHPTTRIVPVNMAPAVEFMITRGLGLG
jgi:excisionase family DNA binding protein